MSEAGTTMLTSMLVHDGRFCAYPAIHAGTTALAVLVGGVTRSCRYGGGHGAEVGPWSPAVNAATAVSPWRSRTTGTPRTNGPCPPTYGPNIVACTRTAVVRFPGRS